MSSAVGVAGAAPPRRHGVCTAAAMLRSEYEAIRAAVSVPSGQQPDLDWILARHPGLSLDTLVSIYSQECTRRVRALHAGHRASGAAYAARWLGGEDALALARAVDLPATLLLQLVLEQVLGVGAKPTSAWLRSPGGPPPPGIRDALASRGDGAALGRRLRGEVERCAAWDHVASPATNELRREAGLEYEELLYARLREAGVPFSTEDELREEGFSRTPDVKLEVPIAVQGRPVHWIDSKASFSDPGVHEEKGLPQFQAYINRFGPGMVVYWLGFVDELNTHPEILLVDDFRPADVVTLPRAVMPRARSSVTPFVATSTAGTRDDPVA